MLIDFFWCSCPMSQERRERAEYTLALWKSVEGIRLHEYRATERNEAWEFQSLRRQWAELESESGIYIVADDDMEPSRTESAEEWIFKGVSILKRHLDFALLSPWLEETRLGPWTPAGYQPFKDEEVEEMHNSGGIRFIRKGAIGGWPPQARRGYDHEHCEALRARGFRSGYFRNLWALHPGGKSETWKPLDSSAM